MAGRPGKRHSANRKGELTPQRFSDFQGKLEKRIGDIKLLVGAMQSYRVKGMIVDGDTKLDRGLKLIDEYLDRVAAILEIEKRRWEREHQEGDK